MKELLATNDIVLLSALRHYLEEEGVEFDVFGTHVGSLFPGDLGIASSRIMVSEDDFNRAKRVLDQLKNGEMACD